MSRHKQHADEHAHREDGYEFGVFRRAILERASRCGGDVAGPAMSNFRHTEAVIAAAAQVVSAHEPGWCSAHPAEFSSEVWDNLGTLAHVVSWLLAIFIPAGPVWLVVIEWVLPVVVDWLAMEQGAALCGAAGADLGVQAESYLKGI